MASDPRQQRLYHLLASWWFMDESQWTREEITILLDQIGIAVAEAGDMASQWIDEWRRRYKPTNTRAT